MGPCRRPYISQISSVYVCMLQSICIYCYIILTSYSRLEGGTLCRYFLYVQQIESSNMVQIKSKILVGSALFGLPFAVSSLAEVQTVRGRERPEVQLLRATCHVSAARGSTGEALAHGLAFGLLRRRCGAEGRSACGAC